MMPSEDVLRDVTQKLPSDDTLRGLVALGPVLASMPRDDTLRQLINLAPQLQSLPSEATLKEVVSLFRQIQPYLERLPSGDDMQVMLKGVRGMVEFMEVLKDAPGGSGGRQPSVSSGEPRK